MEVKERLAAQMAVAFIDRANRAIGWLRLVKLIYLAEREAMRRFFLPIIDDDIFAMPQGMALSNTTDLARGMGEADGDWKNHIVRTSHGLDVRKGVSSQSLDCLSQDDLDVIQKVWERYGNKSQDELIHAVHHKLPEWIEHWVDEDRRSQAVPVPYVTLYKTICGVNDEDARFLAEHYRGARDRWIRSDPQILGGTPIIAGTRVSVYAIRGRLTGGETPECLVEDYPDIGRDAFLAANMFAKAHPLKVHPLGKPWEASPERQQA